MNIFDTLGATHDELKLLKKTRKLNVFTSLEDLGLTSGTETINDIVFNLPPHSMLIFSKRGGYGNDSIYPATAGSVTITKLLNNGRVSFEFDREDALYRGYYNDFYDSAPFTGWVRMNKGIISVYSSLAHLGLNSNSFSSFTSAEQYADLIVSTMKDNSVFQLAVTSNNNPLPNGGNFLPPTIGTSSINGLLTVSKGTGDRVEFEFSYGSSGTVGGAYNDKYHASFAATNTSPNARWSGWSRYLLARTGTGSPEGVIAAPVGSVYVNSSGGAGATLYIKESGTGSTGWAAK